MISFVKLLIVLFPAIVYFAILYVFKRYDCITNKEKLTGFDVARKILDRDKYKEEVIIEVNGELTDCYDIDRETIKLSSKIYHNDSVTSYGVSSFMTHHYIFDKTSKIGKYKTFIDKIINYMIGIAYILIAVGTIFRIIPFTNLGAGSLMLVYLYFMYLVYENYGILKKIKLKNNFDERKYVYYLMLFFDFRKFITVIIDFANMIGDKINK